MTDVSTAAPKTIPTILITFKAAASAFCDARAWAFRPQDNFCYQAMHSKPFNERYGDFATTEFC